ncbi:hypothetical protein C0991_005138 [Blastosporella zonata]|nr:hypothetical protein C0991_005138 [Blastosporella zonata]
MHLQLTLVAGITVAASQVAGSQTPLISYSRFDESSSSYSFKWPIKKVAIIGAGPGGLVNYREFVKAGFDVRLFERDNTPGGNWHYTDEIPLDAPIPNDDISVADFTPSLPPQGAKLPYEEVYHELPHAKIGRYVRAFASFHGANSNDDNPHISFNTRVEVVEKRYNEYSEEAGWTLTLKKVVHTGLQTSKAIWTTDNFDAVVVASGRYNAPNVPNISGLAAWADRFPGKLIHSRQYRRGEAFVNKTVLIVGAATSGGEISRDLSQHVHKIYQSVRPDNSTRNHFQLDLFLRRLPPNVTIVPEIKHFLPPTDRIQESQVELTNGTIISGIDTVLFATGYRYTFPFLPQYHNSSIKHTNDESSAHPRPIVTDGTHLRALYLDTFYIEDPTLGFIDMNVGMQSFTYSEYLAVALTKVWSGKAHIPDTQGLWRIQKERVEDLGGYGPHFQFLGAERTNVLIRLFLGWLNGAAAKYGGRTEWPNQRDLEKIAVWKRCSFRGTFWELVILHCFGCRWTFARCQRGGPD